MKQLREALVILDARHTGLDRTPNDDGYTLVLSVKCIVTTAIADTLRCRNQVFSLNDNSLPGLKVLKLDHNISSCEMTVPGVGISALQPQTVHGFTIQPSRLAGAEGAMEMTFSLKFVGSDNVWMDLNRLCSAVQKNPFELALTALQANLFDLTETTGDGAAGGTRVDMSEPEESRVRRARSNLATM